MKNKTILILSVVMVITTLTGCQPEVTPKPDPVKVYLTGNESFTRVDAAGTLATTAIYQWDTNADGTVDSPAAYYTGDDVAITGYATGCFCFATSAGIKYVNNKYLSDKGYFYSDRWNTVYNDPEYGAEADIRFVVSGSGIIVLWSHFDYDITGEFWVNASWSTFHWNNMGNIVEHAQSSTDGNVFEDFTYVWTAK